MYCSDAKQSIKNCRNLYYYIYTSVSFILFYYTIRKTVLVEIRKRIILLFFLWRIHIIYVSVSCIIHCIITIHSYICIIVYYISYIYIIIFYILSVFFCTIKRDEWSLSRLSNINKNSIIVNHKFQNIKYIS